MCDVALRAFNRGFCPDNSRLPKTEPGKYPFNTLLNHSALIRPVYDFFNRDLLYGQGISQDICQRWKQGGLFRGRPRFGIINTVSTWITPTRAVSVRYNNRSRPNGRDFCQRLIRKLAHTVPIDSVQRFYARLTVLSRAATGATDAAASSQNCIKILARCVEWARNLSRFDSVLSSWWNKLAVCRFFCFPSFRCWGLVWNIIWNSYFWFYSVMLPFVNFSLLIIIMNA